jgi:heat-inducible transcriptional repressor
MTESRLDERHRRILTFVVERHVSRAGPVGSQTIRAAYHLSISPATIRSAMQQLEEMGFLDHPHTSAGRVPTEAGFRLYVDELMKPEPLGSAVRRAVNEALDSSARSTDGEAADPRVPGVLAKMARQLAVVAVSGARVMEGADLVLLDDGLLLLAWRETGGVVATSSWMPPGAPGASDVRRAEATIRGLLPIRSAAEAMAHAVRMREEPGAASAIVIEALERAAARLESEGRTDVRIEGADHIASQPEFQSPDRLRPLVSLLAEREPLARALEAGAGPGRARVSIGSENGPGAMRHCSLVAFKIEGRGMHRFVGVMGPVRMPYRRIVSLVSYVGERLSEREG